MTLAQIVAFTTAKLGLTDATAQSQAAAFAAARWAMVWNHALWRQSRASATVDAPAGEALVDLPDTIDLVLAVRIGADRVLEASHDIDALFADPAGRDAPGECVAFSVARKTADGLTRLRLHRPPATAATLLVIGKRPCPPLVDASDVPLGVPGVDECLCAFVFSDLLQWTRQFAKAQTVLAEATALLVKAVDIETSQNAETRRILPCVQQLETGPDTGWC